MDERLEFVVVGDASGPTQDSETDLPADASSLDDVPELQQVVQERLVLASNTFFECYKGYHLPAGILAWIHARCVLRVFYPFS